MPTNIAIITTFFHQCDLCPNKWVFGRRKTIPWSTSDSDLNVTSDALTSSICAVIGWASFGPKQTENLNDLHRFVAYKDTYRRQQLDVYIENFFYNRYVTAAVWIDLPIVMKPSEWTHPRTWKRSVLACECGTFKIFKFDKLSFQ